MGCAAVMQVLLLTYCVFVAAGYPFKTPLDLDVTPRITVFNRGNCTGFSNLRERVSLRPGSGGFFNLSLQSTETHSFLRCNAIM